MTEASPLGPIDPSSVQEAEKEKAAPWIVRKLVGVRGRRARSSFKIIVPDQFRNVVHDWEDCHIFIRNVTSIGNECRVPFTGM